MGVQRVRYSSQAAPALLSAMREIARGEGRQFEAVVEEAMEAYMANRNRERARPEAVAHLSGPVWSETEG